MATFVKHKGYQMPEEFTEPCMNCLASVTYKRNEPRPSMNVTGRDSIICPCCWNCCNDACLTIYKRIENNCNLTTCRYNQSRKCTNEEKRKECVEISKRVLRLEDRENEIDGKTSK